MVLRLGRLYKVRLDRAHAIGLVQASLATLAGPTLAAEGANQVVKYIPGYGNISNTAVAASITEAIGWICIKWLKTEVGLNKLDNIDCFKTAVFENVRQPGFKQPQASKYSSQNPCLNQVLFS